MRQSHKTFLVWVMLIFAFLVVWARLSTLGRTYEEAALALGADELAATGEVTLPLLAPAVLGGALLSFTVSFELLAYLVVRRHGTSIAAKRLRISINQARKLKKMTESPS